MLILSGVIIICKYEAIGIVLLLRLGQTKGYPLNTYLNWASHPKQFKYDLLHCEVQSLLGDELNDFHKYVEWCVPWDDSLGAPENTKGESNS